MDVVHRIRAYGYAVALGPACLRRCYGYADLWGKYDQGNINIAITNTVFSTDSHFRSFPWPAWSLSSELRRQSSSTRLGIQGLRSSWLTAGQDSRAGFPPTERTRRKLLTKSSSAAIAFMDTIGMSRLVCIKEGIS